MANDEMTVKRGLAGSPVAYLNVRQLADFCMVNVRIIGSTLHQNHCGFVPDWGRVTIEARNCYVMLNTLTHSTK